MGSITPYQTTAGKRYRVRYRKPDSSQTDKRGFKTKRDAELFLATVEVSKAQGSYIDPRASRLTINDLGSRWLEGKSSMKPSAFESLESGWRVYVQPKWGSYAVGDIDHSDVQAWLVALAAGKAPVAEKKSHKIARELSATTVLRCHGILAGILDVAVKDRRLASNPARGVNLPRKVKKAHAYLTHAQVDALAAGSRYPVLVYTLAYTALRWGEATGLRVKHFDELRGRLRVEENAVRVHGQIVVGTPKSHESRSVPVPPFLLEMIAGECQGKSREDLVFGNGTAHLTRPTAKDGWYTSAVSKAKAIDRDFPSPTVHDLRHTAASLAISAGANVKAVQRMLGHASAAMTLDTYADLFDGDLDAVAAAVESARTASRGSAHNLPTAVGE